MMRSMNAPAGFFRRALWGVQMFVLPLLVVFFLCPCGSIYQPNAPHGKRELSAAADFVSTVAVAPVVPLILIGDQVAQVKYSKNAPAKEKATAVGNAAAMSVIAPVVIPPLIIKEEISTLKSEGKAKDDDKTKEGKEGKTAPPRRSGSTHSKQGGL